MNVSKRIEVYLFLIVVIPLVAGSNLFARAWTSQGGAKVEAEFVKADHWFVVLEKEDGKRLKIKPALLSQKDRDYIEQVQSGDKEEVRQLSEEDLEEEFGAAENKQTEPKAAKKKSAKQQTDKKTHVFAPDNLAKPKDLTVKDFPELELDNPGQAIFLGLQYGPASEDVLYLAFDRKDINSLPHMAYVQNYGKTSIGEEQSYAIEGKKSDIETENEEYDTMEFRDINIRSEFGDLKVEGELTFIFGVVRPDVLYALAEVDFQKGYEDSSCMLGRQLTKHMTFASGKIKVIPLFGVPEMDLKIKWDNVNGFVGLGKWVLVPGGGMDKDAGTVIRDEDGRKEDDSKAEWEEEAVFEARRHGDWKWHDMEIEDAGKYNVTATMDLGILGPISSSTSFTIDSKD